MANELRKKMRQLEGTQTLKQLFNKNTKKKKKKKKKNTKKCVIIKKTLSLEIINVLQKQFNLNIK